VGRKARRNTALCFLLVITLRDEKSIQLHDLLVNHEFSFYCVFSVFSFVFIFTKLHLWKREQARNKKKARWLASGPSFYFSLVISSENVNST
jgi:hypothetical protein